MKPVPESAAVVCAIIFCLLTVSLSRPTNDLMDEDAASDQLIMKKKTRNARKKLDIVDINKALGANYFEGDIMMESEMNRNAILDMSKKWTRNVVPYKLEDSYGFEDRMTIFKSLSEFNVRTCVTFRPKEDSDDNYIYIYKGSGCFSSVGMTGSGEQTVSIGYGCEYKGTIQHEAMHALGFWHEQSRYDRDEYVQIIWDNIVPGEEHNFKEYTADQVDTLGIPYDYSSILHYGAKSFSKNHNYTIKVAPSHRKTTSEDDLGQRAGFTKFDLKKIRTLYGCDESQYRGWSEWTDWSDCDDECMRVRWRYCNEDDESSCTGENEQSEACTNCQPNTAGDCGPSEFSGWEGSISSPMFPYNYVNNADCKYHIKKTFDQYPIYVSFVEFNVEYEPTFCAYDNLKVFDSDKTREQMTVCGDRMPADQSLTSPDPMLRFQTDYVTTGRGFKAFYFNVPVLHHCPFEYEPEAYGWAQEVKGDDFDWTWFSGRTPSASTGPSADHSLENDRGHYLYIEASTPRVTDEAAKIYSPIFDSTPTENCMQFHYHMFGNNGMGTLNVYIVNADNGDILTGSDVFSVSGDQGDEWKSVLVSSPKDIRYQFAFEAIRGGGYLSDIAIDDVRLFGVSCHDLQ